MLSTLRRLFRSAGLTRLAAPLVGLWEDFVMRRLGSYSAAVQDKDWVAFQCEGRKTLLPARDQEFVDMALAAHERPTLTTLLTLTQPGWCAWDVGANIGFYSCLLSDLVGEGGRVISFEPNPQARERLTANLALCRSKNTTICPSALGEHATEAWMTAADGYTQVSRIVDAPADKAGLVSTVVESADGLVSQGRAPAPDLVKMDVEGFETEALSGMKAVLATPSCKVVLCEVHFSLLQERGRPHAVREIRQMFTEAGFTRVGWIARSHLLARK